MYNQIITFNMNPKVALVTINRVFFITNTLNADEYWKRYYHKKKYNLFMLVFWQTTTQLLASDAIKICNSYGVWFLYRRVAIFDLRKMRRLIRVNNDY